MALSEIVSRLERFTEYDPNSGCHLWAGAVRRFGYGCITVNRKARVASRVSYEAHVGPIPAGQMVCHRCDTPSCINPAHLFLGTHADNMRDKTRKGRGRVSCNVGNRNANALLTPDSVREIRRQLAAGKTAAQIATQHGVAPQTIGMVRQGRSWRHVS